jgi:pSer/pThr/pTyr-binding forkhead associated (FHA) protein
MNVRLVVEKDRKRVRVIHLSPPVAVLGRGPGNAVRIPSAEVSRKHCKIRMKQGFVTVEDLESVNGTYLNGEAVEGEQVVRPGDHLEVGPVEFIVEYQPSPEALARLNGDDDEAPELLVVAEDDDEETDSPQVDDDAAPPTLRPPRDEDDAPVPLAGDDEPLPPREPVLSEDVRLQLPEGGDLRDILQHLDEGEEEAPKPRNPARPVKEKPPEKPAGQKKPARKKK